MDPHDYRKSMIKASNNPMPRVTIRDLWPGRWRPLCRHRDLRSRSGGKSPRPSSTRFVYQSLQGQMGGRCCMPLALQNRGTRTDPGVPDGPGGTGRTRGCRRVSGRPGGRPMGGGTMIAARYFRPIVPNQHGPRHLRRIAVRSGVRFFPRGHASFATRCSAGSPRSGSLPGRRSCFLSILVGVGFTRPGSPTGLNPELTPGSGAAVSC